MDNNNQVSTIAFYGSSLSTINKEGIEYVALRPIVEGIGLEWSGQQKKLAANKDKFSCVDMYITGKDGKRYQMLTIPIKKLNGYLFSINPEKVKANIKDKLILYQEECFTALHDHFTKGFSLNKQLLETSEEKRDRLSRELRHLRINDQDLYKKLTDAISVTCSDYKSKDRRELNSFFATMQDSFHFAVSGYTAAELVYYNIDSIQITMD